MNEHLTLAAAAVQFGIDLTVSSPPVDAPWWADLGYDPDLDVDPEAAHRRWADWAGVAP